MKLVLKTELDNSLGLTYRGMMEMKKVILKYGQIFILIYFQGRMYLPTLITSILLVVVVNCVVVAVEAVF